MSSFNIGQRSQNMPNLAEIQNAVAARETRKTQQTPQTQQTQPTQQTHQTINARQAQLKHQKVQKNETGFTPENFQQLIMAKNKDQLQQQAMLIEEVPELQGMLEELNSEHPQTVAASSA